MGVVVSFSELTPIPGAMTDEPDQADTKLSQAGDSMELEATIRRKLYLKEVNDRGLEPRWHGGAIVAPRHRGRIIQGCA
jgi:hypothetical protein